MKKQIELLAPGGDLDSIKAAIIAGADAVYCGLGNFNARNRATNISFEEFIGVLGLAHKNNCKIFLTLNIIILESEIPAFVNLLNKLLNTSVDAIIVQDLGILHLLSKYFKSFEVHASTQLTTHNSGQIKFLKKLSVSRVNLSREMSLVEINELTKVSHENNISTEVFVHGSNCISFSGICYMSSVIAGNSGNRGRCSQPCREQYLTTSRGIDYPLNIKDKSAFYDLKELYDAKVDSLKIEGRIKKFHYVHTVVSTWRKHINQFFEKNKLSIKNTDLYKVFNRDFSNDFLKGNISKDMFIDNPRDNSAKHFLKLKAKTSSKSLEEQKKELYDEKTKIIHNINDKINELKIGKIPLIINISGEANKPLKISIKTPDNLFVVESKSNLVVANDYKRIKESLKKKFNFLNNLEYYINSFEFKGLESNLFISFKEVSELKDRVSFLLNNSKELLSPVEIPKLQKQSNLVIKPKLSVLISSKDDLYLSKIEGLELFYEIPDSLGKRYLEFVNLFLDNKNIIPWFPSVLIGKDFEDSVRFLNEVRPKLIVTNNTGIAYKAYKRKIPWIAGPYINVVNSFTLLSLKENFDCYGSFISNEINKKQIKKLKNPKNLKLYYSVYHPLLLLTTRQCLFHQVTGCKKSIMDDQCITGCSRESSITNMKNNELHIKKTQGSYHRIYNNQNFLNLDIINDLPNFFSNFFIDLRNIKTDTIIKTQKENLINLFKNALDGNLDSINEINKLIELTTNKQYKKGL